MKAKRQFEDFMSRSYRIFCLYCTHTRGQKPEDADEIVCEAFARLYRIWGERFGCDERLNKKWMYNAIDYIILEYSRQRRGEQTEPLEDWGERIADPAQIDEDLLYRDYIAGIERELSEDDRALFRCLYIECIPYDALCARLNISSGALRTRVSRLKNRIAGILKNESFSAGNCKIAYLHRPKGDI